MIETTELLYSILFISVTILLFMYNRKIINNAFNYFKPSAAPSVEKYENHEESTNYFNTETDGEYFNTDFEVTENANGAITNALKDI
jgi:hypothetical protein